MKKELRKAALDYLVQGWNQEPLGKWALDSTGTWMPLDMAEFGAKYMLDKVCEWLDGAIYDYVELKNERVDTFMHIHDDKLKEDLRKAMELDND